MSRDFLHINTPTRKNRKSKWGIDYYSPWETNPDGTAKRVKRFFKSKAERDEEIDRLTKRYQANGSSAGATLAPADEEDFRIAKGMLPPGVSLREACRYYATQHVIKGPPLKDALAAYVAACRRRGMNERWVSAIESVCGRVITYLPAGIHCGDVTTEQLRRWIDSMKGVYVDETRNNWRRILHGAYEQWIMPEYRLTANPVSRVEIPKVDRPPPRFYPTEEVRRILQAALWTDPDLLAVFALRFFAGFRMSEILRMPEGCLLFESGVIDVPGILESEDPNTGRKDRIQITKNRKRHIVENVPWLWPWLSFCPVIDTRNFLERMREVRHLAGVKSIKNGDRHSFATYHCALRKNANETMLIMGQEEDSKAFWNHYRNPSVTQPMARDYFRMTPANVFGW